MKVLLIYPPLTLHHMDVSAASRSLLMGLGYVAGALKTAGHEVTFVNCLTAGSRISATQGREIDRNFTRYGLLDNEILAEIKAAGPDVVGVACMYTSYFKDAHNVAGIVKQHDTDILVVFGGAHTSTFPEIVMRDDNVDIAVVGEGEITMCEIVDRYEKKESFKGVKGIVHRVEGKITREEPREFIQNLDELPFPAWDVMGKDMELAEQTSAKDRFIMRSPLGRVLTSRGCPNDCYFCSVKLAWSRRWRARSAKSIVDEVEFLKDTYGCREIHFVDDNSSVSKKRMHEICDELLARRMDVKLATPTGIAVATLDRELLVKMKKAGFYRFCFGFESGDQESQKIIKKRIDLDQARQVIADANRLGFWTSGTFIIGFPHETMQEIRNTIDFIKTSGIDFAIIYLLVPQPGTEVYEIFKEQGLIDLDGYLDPNCDEWYKISLTYSNGFKSRHFSNKELQSILSMAYKEFLRHKLLSAQTYVNVCRKVRSFEDLVYLLGLTIVPLRMMGRMLIGRSLSNISIRPKPKKELSEME